MKILMLSDLHNRQDFFSWIDQVAPEYDLVAMAGDLLDDPQGLDTLAQIKCLDSWMEKYSKHPTQFALCSGNHDANEERTVDEDQDLETLSEERKTCFERLFKSPRWMDAYDRYPKVTTDGRTRLIQSKAGEKLVITTIPYLSSEIDNSALLTKGSEVRTKEKCPWLVLHHVPPFIVGTVEERAEPDLTEWIQQWKPDYVLSGHIHELPLRKKGAFELTIGNTICINAGANLGGEVKTPNYITLEPSSQKVKWYNKLKV